MGFKNLESFNNLQAKTNICTFGVASSFKLVYKHIKEVYINLSYILGNNTIELASTKYVFACFEVTISPLYIYTYLYGY